MTVAMMSKCTLEKKTSSCSLVEPLALDGAVWCEILRTRTRESLHVKRQEKSVSRILGIIFPGRERRHQQQRGCKEVLSARLLGFGPGGRAQFARLSQPAEGPRGGGQIWGLAVLTSPWAARNSAAPELRRCSRRRLREPLLPRAARGPSRSAGPRPPARPRPSGDGLVR